MTGTEGRLLEAAILVGGAGTRLKSIMRDRPKPMAVVGGKPFLEWLIVSLRKRGIARIVLCTGYRSDAIEKYFGDGVAWGLEIVYSHESVPLGTGGAIRKALDKLDTNSFLLMNGDSYSDFTMSDLIATHRARRASATIVLVRVDDSLRYGTVVLNKDNAVVSFIEKATKDRGALINAGVYLFKREVIAEIAPGKVVSLEHDVLPKLAGRGLYGMVVDGERFVDIGTPESYEAANNCYSLWQELAQDDNQREKSR